MAHLIPRRADIYNRSQFSQDQQPLPAIAAGASMGPRPAHAFRRWRKVKTAKKNCPGFTIVELLIVITIIGIVAAITVPNLLNALQRGKQKSTMSNIRSIGTAIEAYGVDVGFAPAQASFGNIQGTIQFVLQPTYIKLLPTQDAWKTTIKYVAASPDSYSIRSYGKDGVNDGNNSAGTTSKYDNDILFADGQFIILPEGLQD
jgi:general secretion pathway protein G